jgi:ABC-2 type transport system ATP-binding protein
MSDPILEVSGLSKRYGDVEALSAVDLRIDKGEIFGLLGPNGAGKTTLLSIISCLVEPTSGAARLQEESLTSANRELRRRIGLVPQELAIYQDMTGRENLQFFGGLYKIPHPELQARIAEILRTVGLEDRADSRVSTYSGGMKRRLNLGAALVHSPQLLLLDEPTAGVDPQTRNHIFEEVRRLNAAGVTIVYTSHYMEEVQALCNRVAILDRGKVIACDTLPRLLGLLGSPVRIRVSTVTPGLLARLAALPQTAITSPGATTEDWVEQHTIELCCQDVRATMPRLLALLNELNIRLIDLQMQEPNLEQVFLKLTQRALRD